MILIDFNLLCGDIKQTQGLTPKNIKIFPFASGILIAPLPMLSEEKKILESLDAMHKFDVICSSDAVLNNTYDQDYK